MNVNKKCTNCQSVMSVEKEKETQVTYFCSVCGKRQTQLKAEHRREFIPYGK